MDIFIYNLQNHAYYTKLNNAKLSTASGYRLILLQNDLMDLNTVKFSNSSGSLPNNV